MRSLPLFDVAVTEFETLLQFFDQCLPFVVEFSRPVQGDVAGFELLDDGFEAVGLRGDPSSVGVVSIIVS